MQTIIKNTFQKIPKQLLEKKLSPKAVYLYAKLEMLKRNDKAYSERALGINPISKGLEMERHTISSLADEIEAAGLMTSDLELMDGNSYPTRVYTLCPIEGYFKPVYNDFINRPDISPAEKGFAILLTLLDEIPTSYKALQRATGVSDITCKKYMDTLTSKGIVSGGMLSRDSFPNLIEDALDAKYQTRYAELRACTGNRRIQNKLDWMDKILATQSMPTSWKLVQLEQIELGTWERAKARKEIEKITNTKITL